MKHVGTNTADEALVTQAELDEATQSDSPKITVSETEPVAPQINDLWVQLPV